MRKYLYDVTLTAFIEIEATTAEVAHKKLLLKLNNAYAVTNPLTAKEADYPLEWSGHELIKVDGEKI